ncbi:stage III sporulation protein AA [Fodinisporobacter ferrooxydans]|uniref:Stage III sporulation protein AA n=1 Tax=Fodinisporobacter ferrooxydans TaxID=2901836 RepID=A0ABY4CKX8_9BACL|nr:stage III sporulation protein AA [Alicyclobacillaceae bacterium MYW30-H2]
MAIAETKTQRALEQQILSVLPQSFRERFRQLFPNISQELQEIRLRLGRPLQFHIAGNDYFVTAKGRLTEQQQEALLVQAEDVEACLQLITKSSFYALEEELRKGFITIEGGHRVGIAGRVVLDASGSIQTMRDITHINIRIAKAIHEASRGLENLLSDTVAKTIWNTLIIAPPQCGKTTILRDLCRRISNGTFHRLIPGLKVGLVDERSELAAAVRGIPQHDVGVRTDILDACPKAQGMQMLIRSMSPDVIMTDELGRDEDAYAVMEALYAGVKVVSTIHGIGIEDAKKRHSLERLFRDKAFQRFVVLSRRKGVCTIESVLNEEGRILSEWRRDCHV